MDRYLYKYIFLEKEKYIIRKERYLIDKEKEDSILYKMTENVDCLILRMDKSELDKIEKEEGEKFETYSMMSLDDNKLVDFTEQITNIIRDDLNNKIKELQKKKSWLNGVKQKAIKVSKLKIKINNN